MTLDLHCTLCRNVVDAEDLFCANCGREVPHAEGSPAAPTLEQGLTGFDCRACGASTTWDAGAKALRCAFCGSEAMERQAAPTGRVEPSRLVGFRVPEAEAVKRFRTWLGTGFWRPRGIAQEARLVSMQAVYIPCWRFAALTRTNWVADSSATPAFAKADWCPVGGRSEGRVEDALVLASGSLTKDEITGLLPYDLGAGEPYARAALGAVPVEDFGVSRRGARPEARLAIEAVEVARCTQFVPGRARNVHVNVLVEDLTSEPVLLPVWINAYRWKERVFRFLVNGQTGAIVGQAPRSLVKALLLLLAFVLVVVGIFLLRS